VNHLHQFITHNENTFLSGKTSRKGLSLQDNRAPVAQRVKNDSPTGIVQCKVNYTQKQLPDELKQNLAQKIIVYNTYPLAKSNQKIALHKQFEMLHGIESTVNAYLKSHSKTIPDKQRLELFRILRQTEKDHIKLTGRLAANGQDIWLGHTNLSDKKKAQTQRLWHSLRRNQGNVKIQTGDPKFKNEVLSGYVHLLGGDHGRGLLRELNKFHSGHGQVNDPQKRIVISDSFQQHYERLGKGGEYKAGSSAEAYGSLHYTDNKDHRKGIGSGSYVQIQHETPKQLDEYETDKKGKPIHAPKFITLGHELGHARHNLRGNAGYISDWSNKIDPKHPLHGDGAKLERKKWTGSEEYENIRHEENPIRSEHGLPVRKYHATKKAQLGHKRSAELSNLLDVLDARVPVEPRYTPLRQQLGVFIHRINVTTDMANDAQVAALRKDMTTFQRNLPTLLRNAQRQHQLSRVRNFLPSKKQLLIGSLGLLGAGLTVGYFKGWFGGK
jgi:hypothetical protein